MPSTLFAEVGDTGLTLVAEIRDLDSGSLVETINLVEVLPGTYSGDSTLVVRARRHVRILSGTDPVKQGYADIGADVDAITYADRSANDEINSVLAAMPAAVDAQLLDAGDATDLIASIVSRIGNTNVDETVFVAAIRNDLERAGGNLATLLARQEPLTTAQTYDQLEAAIQDVELHETDGKLDAISNSISEIDGARFYPVHADAPRRVSGTTIRNFQNEEFLQHILLMDDSGAVSTIGRTLDMTIEDRNQSNVNEQIATSREDGFSFTTPRLEPADYMWSVRDGDTDEVIAFGEYVVEYVPE